MFQVSSLNGFLSGSDVLSLLGVEAPPAVTPSVATCPLCGSYQLHLYHDGMAGGEWHHCQGCQHYGDMIELSAAAWKLEIPAAIRRLQALGAVFPEAATSEEAVQQYLTKHVGFRRHVREFWETARMNFFAGTSDVIHRLRRRMGVFWRPDAASWLQQGGQVIGASTKQQAMATFWAGSHRWSLVKKHAHADRSGANLFRGPGWSDILVTPFYDLPERICGFLFVGRNADPAQDFLYYPVYPGRAPNGYSDAGLAMLYALLQGPHPQLGDAKFVFTDPCLAVQLQLRHLRASEIPLPVAAAHRGTRTCTKTPWDWLPVNDLIVWSAQLNPQAIAFARDARATVSTYNISPQLLSWSLTNYSGLEILQRVKQQAIPWTTALQQMLQPASELRIEEILGEIKLAGEELRQFAAGCTPELQERIRHAVKDAIHPQRTVISGKEVMEIGDSWRAGPKREVICDAIIRIEQMMVSENGRNYYRGIVRHQGQSFPFIEQTKRLDAGLFTWARQFLGQNGRTLKINAAWNQQGMTIALAFHEPEVTYGASAVGWEPKTRKFVFPKFMIGADGTVEQNHARMFADGMSPAQHLGPPAVIGQKDVEALREVNPETQLFWATAACLARNLVAPAMNNRPTPVYVLGDGASHVVPELARRFGCMEANNARTLTAAQQHRWPTVMMMPNLSWIAQDPDNVLASIPTDVAMVLGIRGTWIGIGFVRPLGSVRLLSPSTAQVLPAYLQNLCQRRLWLPGDGLPTLRNILRDMAGWFENQCQGFASAVTAARRVLRLPERVPAWKYFVRLVQRLRETGWYSQIGSVDSYQDSKTGIVELRQDRHVTWISQQRFSEGVHKLTGLYPDVLLITKALRQENVLREGTYQNDFGWFIDEPWWSEQIQSLTLIWR